MTPPPPLDLDAIALLLKEAIEEVDYLHSDKNGCLAPDTYPPCSICEWRWRANSALGGAPIKRPAELLTSDEMDALDLTGELANGLRRIIGDGPSAEHDWAEASAEIHAIQQRLLAQAGARAYPQRFRLMGGVVSLSDQEPKPPKEGD